MPLCHREVHRCGEEGSWWQKTAIDPLAAARSLWLDRAAELNLSGETVDRVSGLPERYAQKLLGPNQIQKLGAISLGPFLGALAVRGLIIEDKARSKGSAAKPRRARRNMRGRGCALAACKLC